MIHQTFGLACHVGRGMLSGSPFGRKAAEPQQPPPPGFLSAYRHGKVSAMYAIIEDSGSQIKVSEGQEIFVARRELADDVATVVFNKVLFVSDAEGEEDESASGDDSDGTDVKIGEPYIDGAKVTADILAKVRSPKVPVVKFKRRKNYIRRKSHRQDLLKVKITSIQS